MAIECQGHCEDMPQMSKKNDQGKEKEVETGQKELTEEEKAALYSVPDKKRFQTAEVRFEGLPPLVWIHTPEHRLFLHDTLLAQINP